MEISLDQNGNPILNQFSEEGFVDCVFKIFLVEETESHYLLNLKASFNSQVVGFKAKLFKGIENGFDAEMNAHKDRFYTKGIIFYSSGEESNLLITALSCLYGLELAHPAEAFLVGTKESYIRLANLILKLVEEEGSKSEIYMIDGVKLKSIISEEYLTEFGLDIVVQGISVVENSEDVEKVVNHFRVLNGELPVAEG